jgi:hypothetical protein
MLALLRWYFDRVRFWLVVIFGMALCATAAKAVGWLFANMIGPANAEAYFVIPISFVGFLIIGALVVERSEWLHRFIFPDA